MLLARSFTLPLDGTVTVDLNHLASHGGWYVTLLKVISDVFAPVTFQLVAVALAVCLTLRRRFRLAAWAAFTVLLGALVNSGVKHWVSRTRPVVAHPVAHAVGSSFPSGHAFGAMVGVVMLLVLAWPRMATAPRRRAAVAGALIVLAVGFSRIALGVHFLSDVLGAYLLALCWLAGCFALLRPWRSARAAA